jgi:hypothetical protein
MDWLLTCLSGEGDVPKTEATARAPAPSSRQTTVLNIPPEDSDADAQEPDKEPRARKRKQPTAPAAARKRTTAASQPDQPEPPDRAEDTTGKPGKAGTLNQTSHLVKEEQDQVAQKQKPAAAAPQPDRHERITEEGAERETQGEEQKPHPDAAAILARLRATASTSQNAKDDKR